MLKRAFDIAGSFTGLIIVSPLLLALAVLVRMKLGSPVLFRQQRPGIRGEPFVLVKFRTMINKQDESGAPLPDSRRLTPFGRCLRTTSMDELPELWNVLRGDMSFVGPRPLLMGYLPLYSENQARRHEVKPGLTGWAQVNGRNSLNWEDKFAHDVWYVDNRTFMLDLRILLMTIGRVFSRHGISADGEATMPPFAGSGSQ